MTTTDDEREERRRRFDEQARRDREEAAQEHAARLREAAKERKDRQVPGRYSVERTGTALDGPVANWANELQSEISPLQRRRPDERGHYGVVGPSILVLGPVGVGKTHQAFTLVHWLFEQDLFRDVKITTAVELFASLRPRPGIDNEEVFESYAHVDLLLLDDLGTGKDSEFTEEISYRLIDYRYNHEKPTVITSNVPPKELAAKLGDRTASRLQQMCDTVVLKGEDRRRQEAA